MTTFTNWTFSVAGNVGPTGPTGTVSLASPAFSGTPTAPTAAAGTNTTQLATTEFVTTAASNVTSGFRNKIINGDMRINQRGASTSSTNVGYLVDRWVMYAGSNLTSLNTSTDAPAGFTNSIYAECTTASGPASYHGIVQLIEGNNIPDLGFGTAWAKPVVVSFWVKSTKTGVANFSFANNGNLRTYTTTYTIDVANTWEKKIIYINGDTSGTWLTTNGMGLRLWWDLGSTASYNTTVNTWVGTDSIRTSSQTHNLTATLNARLYLTGVQLEVGSQPTPFEQRPIGTELALCQRYFHVIPAGNIKAVNQYATVGLSGGNLLVSHTFPVTMRADPTAYTSAGSGSHSFDFYQSSAGSGIARVLVYQSGQSTTTIGFKTLAYSSDNNGGNVLPSNGHLIGILNTAVWVSAEL